MPLGGTGRTSRHLSRLLALPVNLHYRDVENSKFRTRDENRENSLHAYGYRCLRRPRVTRRERQARRPSNFFAHPDELDGTEPIDVE